MWMFDGVLLSSQSSIHGKFQAAICFRDFCSSSAHMKEAIIKDCQLLKVARSSVVLR